MLIPLPPKYRRRAPKNRTSEWTPSPVVKVTVVSVSAMGGQQALWMFSSPVMSAEQALGLSISTEIPDNWEITGDGALLVT